MGSCISKCKPKKKSKQPLSPAAVQDKLVISQEPVPPPVPAPKLAATLIENPKPRPSPSRSTTTGKFTATSSSSSSSSSASSAYCSSSAFVAKDRSFSNEFLWSCVKENQHLVTLKPKAADQKSPKFQYPKDIGTRPLVKTRSPAQEKEASRVPTPKKRARASSPTVVRQKSFRKEPTFSYVPNRALRSPSPSRRFCNNGPRVNDMVSSCPRRESFRAPRASPNQGLAVGPNFSLAKKGSVISRRASAEIEDQEIDVVMEDINNPHIALDCFIFL